MLRVRLACLFLLPLLLCPLAARAQVKGVRSLDELSEKTGVPLKLLKSSKADRLLAADVYERRAFVKEHAEEPKGRLLPVFAYLAQHDPDWPIQLTAIKVLSCFALSVDRRDVVETIFPLLETNCEEEGTQLLRYSFEEVLRLNRWFRCDERLAPLLKQHFDGPDFNIRGLAFKGITQFKHPRLIEEMVIPCAWTIFKSRKVSKFDRQHSIRTLARHEVPEALPKIQGTLFEGPVSIVSAYSLARFLDPSSLKALRKINKSSVHRVRMGAWLARVRLNDRRCLKDIVKIVNDHTEHDEIKRTFVGDLGQMTEHHKTLRKLLEKLKKHKNPQVVLGTALALAQLGDDSLAPLLVETLNGPWPDLQNLRWRGHGWKRRFGFMESILRIDTPAVNSVIVAMIDVKGEKKDLYDEEGKDAYQDWYRHGSRRSERMRDWYDEYRAEAVRLCGERKIQEALPRLEELSKDKWGHLKLHALISRIELGDEDATRFLSWYLPKYDDRYWREVKAVMGKTTLYSKRMKWSSVFDVCDKFERVGDEDLYLPVVEEMLKTEDKQDDPMKKGWATKLGGGKQDPTKTAERGEVTQEPPLFRPPEVAYRTRNQFARRRLVECAARLGDNEAAPILARALRDSRATVRAASLIEIGRISGLYVLHPGSALSEELKVWPAAVEWLREQDTWPE